MKRFLLLLMTGLLLAPGAALAGDRPSHAEKRLQASIDRIERTLRSEARRARFAVLERPKPELSSTRIMRKHVREYRRRLYGHDRRK